MNKMKIKIFTLLGLIITFSLTLSSCDSLWDDLNNITVSFDSNSGTGTMEPQEFVADVPQTLNENTFTREGYTFAGWATSADATTAEYADKAEFTAKEDITLYAIWNIIPPVNPPAPEPSKVTITYVSDKGTLPESKTVEQGYKLTAEDLPTLTETGYRFINWDKVVGDEITSDTTITARWIKTWNISYASNKSELNDKLPVSKTVDEGYKLTADDLTALTADGYNFKGWDKSVGDVISSDTTITASWKKTWKITYSLPSGYSKDPKVVEEGYKLTSEDLPNIEINDTYYMLNKNVGYEITADTQITGDWDGIVYLNTFSKIPDIKNNKAKIEKIVFTSDTYSGATTPIACADNSTNPAIPTDYFKGILTDGTVSGQYILTIYGNGHRIYAPISCKQLFNAFSKLTSIEFNNFYTSKVTDMSQMFYTCRALSSLDLSSFDTSSVQTMLFMFGTCIALTSLNISSFNTSNVTDFAGMFSGLNEITELNLSNFDTSKATSMQLMFSECNKLTSVNLSSFNTSLVNTMNGMFTGCQAIEYIDVSKFNTSAVTDMAKMFSSCKKLKELNLSGFVTSSVTTMMHMFNSCEKLKELDLSSFDTSSVEKMVSMFQSAKSLERIVFSSNFNTDKVTDMNSMFDGCSNLTTLDVSNFNTEKVTNMKSMFKDCSRLITLDVSKFNTGKVTDMTSMFDGCSSFTTLDISSFTITSVSNIANCGGLFSNCTNLTTIYVSSAFDLSSNPNPIIFYGDTKLVGGSGTKYEDIASSDPDHCGLTKYAHIDGGTGNPGYFTLKQ